MGIIRRQSIKNTIIAYAGAFIGFITVGLIFPNVLTTSQNGLIKIITAFGIILAQFSMFGTAHSTYRIFPYFKNKENKHYGFLFIPLIVTFIGFVIVSVIFLIFKDPLLSNKSNDTNLLDQYYWLIILYAFFTAYFKILDAYSIVLLRSVRGFFLNQFLQRVLIVLVALLFAYHFFQFDLFIHLYVFVAAIAPIILLIILLLEKEIPFKSYLKKIKKTVYKHFIDISLFAIISGFSGVAIMNIDSIMLNKLTTLGQTGIYAIMYYFGSIVMLPTRSMNNIAGGLIVQYWKDKKMDEILSIYKKTAISQLIVGMWIFMGVWCNLHNIFHLIPKDYQAGFYVMFYIGIGSLINMSFGCNKQILAFSKYYRYDTYLMFLLIFITIALNLLLIPIYGITGAAIASALSILIYNLVRFILIWMKFELQPFNLNNLWCVVLGVSCILIGMYLPRIDQFILDFIYRSVIITVIYAFFVYQLKLSKDINEFIELLWNKLFSKN